MSQDDPNKTEIDPATQEPRRQKREGFPEIPVISPSTEIDDEEDDGMVRIHLEPCPCGKTPMMLMMELDRDKKRGHVFGDCCSEWMVEFSNNYNVDKDKMAARAKVAWNRAPRPDSS